MKNWMQLPLDALAATILQEQRSAVRKHLSEREWRRLDRMQKRLAELSSPMRSFTMTDDTNALSWWHAKKALRGSRNEWWALAGCSRYVVAFHGDYWGVHHQPYGRRRRQLGTAATAEEAMAIAQADYNHLAQGKNPGLTAATAPSARAAPSIVTGEQP